MLHVSWIDEEGNNPIYSIDIHFRLDFCKVFRLQVHLHWGVVCGQILYKFIPKVPTIMFQDTFQVVELWPWRREKCVSVLFNSYFKLLYGKEAQMWCGR